MTRRTLALLVSLLLLAGAGLAVAQAAGPSITLTWSYTNDTVNPATSFAIQRCVQLSSGCSMLDLSGATALPVTTLTYSDGTITANITYCYQIAAANAFGRSRYSPVTCGTIGTPPTQSPQNVQLKLNLPSP
jgi:hypothetical protein